jgi:hypothetical protein
VSTISSIASPPVAPQALTGKDAGKTSGVSGQAAPVTSPEPQISPRARVLTGFFEAASAFIQEEHLEPFTGWKFSNGRSGYILNRESAYLDVEKYNNYLFDKAATTLVEQAGQMGLALDKDETLAQLKADNADIAAIRFNNTERVKYLEMDLIVYSNLSRDEVNSLTDMYITARENGLDTSPMAVVASQLSIYNRDQKDKIIVAEAYDVPGTFPSTVEELADHDAKMFARIQDKIDMAGELKAKLPNVRFGFDDESGFFERLLNPRTGLTLNNETLGFLLKMADLGATGPASGETWSWSTSTGWTTDPDSAEAAAARSAYAEWLEKTAAHLEKYFGDKTGNAASSPDKTDVSGQLTAALDKIAEEKELLAQLLRPLPRPANIDDDRRWPPSRLDAEATTPARSRPNGAGKVHAPEHEK